MNKVFQANVYPYNLRNPRILASRHKSTIKYGINTIAFQDLPIWKKHSLRNKKFGIT